MILLLFLVIASLAFIFPLRHMRRLFQPPRLPMSRILWLRSPARVLKQEIRWFEPMPVYCSERHYTLNPRSFRSSVTLVMGNTVRITHTSDCPQSDRKHTRPHCSS